MGLSQHIGGAAWNMVEAVPLAGGEHGELATSPQSFFPEAMQGEGGASYYLHHFGAEEPGSQAFILILVAPRQSIDVATSRVHPMSKNAVHWLTWRLHRDFFAAQRENEAL